MKALTNISRKHDDCLFGKRERLLSSIQMGNTKMTETDLQKKLGKRIKMIRKKRNMTQNELSEACGFEKASMSRIESGQSNLTIRTLFKIARALDVNMAELFRG